MAKKTPRYYYHRYNMLIGWGFLPFEAREIARHYSSTQIRRLPYIQSMIRTRRLYVSGLRKKGYSNSEIRDRVYALYDTKDWLTDGRPDIWQMLRKYRGASIDRHDYVPPRRKGSHHKGGISKGDLQGQRQRRRAKTKVQQRDDLNQEIIRAIGSGNQELRRKLEAKRNRLYGY